MVTAIKLSELTNLFLTGARCGHEASIDYQNRDISLQVFTLPPQVHGPHSRPNQSPEKMVLSSHKYMAALSHILAAAHSPVEIILAQYE